MIRLFAFRFDVDTHRCVRVGMPALSRLGRELDAPFTFFVNMGRAVSRPHAALAALGGRRRGRARATAAKHGARTKLGTSEWLRAALLNPRVGSGAPEVLSAALADGHEIGLHGGRNHAVWQAEALDWPTERVADEIDAALPRLEAILGGTPSGFASPGWVSPPALPELLVARGFRYLADEHGPPRRGGGERRDEPTRPRGPLPSVRTVLTGEPGGVAYLEHLDAEGLSEAETLLRFEGDLREAGPVAVAYDHPYWAGTRGLRVVERMVGVARSAGYEVVPLAEIASRVRDGEGRDR